MNRQINTEDECAYPAKLTFKKVKTSNNRFNWGFLPCSEVNQGTYPPELTAKYVVWELAEYVQNRRGRCRAIAPLWTPNPNQEMVLKHISGIKLYTFN